MPAFNGIFDGDCVRTEHTVTIKRIAEATCNSFHWHFEHLNNEMREGIKYTFDDGHVHWLIPSELDLQKILFSSDKLKHRLLRHLSNREST